MYSVVQVRIFGPVFSSSTLTQQTKALFMKKSKKNKQTKALTQQTKANQQDLVSPSNSY